MKKMESILSTDDSLIFVFSTFGLFIVAALLEIGGGYLVWLWLREKKDNIWFDRGNNVVYIWD